jgi:hypothetical protein
VEPHQSITPPFPLPHYYLPPTTSHLPPFHHSIIPVFPADFETRMRFPVCKLIDRLRTDWQDDQSLPVQLARAQIAALRTAGDPEGRYQAKWQLVRNLYNLGYNAQQVRELFGLIDWMMHLRPDLEERFKQELEELEESFQMPYVTSVERIAKSEGRSEGRAEGGATLLLKQLCKRWGEIPASIREQIQALQIEQLFELGEAVLDFHTIQDLEDWLERHTQTD